MLNRCHSNRREQRGLSIVEFMIGITVGLLLLAGAINIFTTNLVNSRRLMTETRVNQNLRAAADLITRDLRRAGYWGNAIQGTTAVGAGAAAASNVYSGISTPTSGAVVNYNFSRDITENNTLDNNEQFGYRLNNNSIEMLVGAPSTWVAITDPKVVTVDSLTIDTTNVRTMSLGYICPKTCNAGTPNCPSITVRSYGLVITGHSASDSSVTRRLETVVRPRTDQLQGQCPA
ncbi:MAG TPA: hypothetical protein VFP68_06150 [Burkholderiaceae bacterium]|nr:hypothetical protein [Burkholderiaceae bacterium]